MMEFFFYILFLAGPTRRSISAYHHEARRAAPDTPGPVCLKLGVYYTLYFSVTLMMAQEVPIPSFAGAAIVAPQVQFLV